MKITFQKNIAKDLFTDFNLVSFPERGKLNEKLINFRYYNPLNQGDFLKDNVIALEDNGQIIAQALYHPAAYFFQGKRRVMEWGFDLFVRADKRKDSVGLHLFDFIKANKKKEIFAAGVGEKALKIEKFYGYHIIGYLKKYYKVVNPLFLVTGLLRRRNIGNDSFPQKLLGSKRFTKILFKDVWNSQLPYNNDLLEFERDEQFMKWRFYSQNSDYVTYREEASATDDKTPIYFVVRTVKIRNITTLVLVDYRYSCKLADDFDHIIEAAIKLANKLLLPVLVTGSSHFVSDECLEKNNFKTTGRDRPVICNAEEYKLFNDRIKARNFLFCTFADSDGEYLM